MDLGNKTALITGASRGLGRSLAGRMAAEGAKVVLVARDEAEVLAAARAIRKEGGAAFAVPGDVGDKESAHRIASGRTRRLAGAIDVPRPLREHARVRYASPGCSTTSVRGPRARLRRGRSSASVSLDQDLVAGAMALRTGRHHRQRDLRRQRSTHTRRGAPTASPRRRSIASRGYGPPESPGGGRGSYRPSAPARWTRGCTLIAMPDADRASAPVARRCSPIASCSLIVRATCGRPALASRPGQWEVTRSPAAALASRGIRNRSGFSGSIPNGTRSTDSSKAISPRPSATRRSARRQRRGHRPRLAARPARGRRTSFELRLLAHEGEADRRAGAPFVFGRTATGASGPRIVARAASPARGANACARRERAVARVLSLERRCRRDCCASRFEGDAASMWRGDLRRGSARPVLVCGGPARALARAVVVRGAPLGRRAAFGGETVDLLGAREASRWRRRRQPPSLTRRGCRRQETRRLDAVLPLDERYDVPAATVAAIAAARAGGGRVVAVGTTVVRALEGCADAHGGELLAGEAAPPDLRLACALEASGRQRSAHRDPRAGDDPFRPHAKLRPAAPARARSPPRRARRVSAARVRRFHSHSLAMRPIPRAPRRAVRWIPCARESGNEEGVEWRRRVLVRACRSFEQGELAGHVTLGKFEAHYEEIFAEVIEDGVITLERARCTRPRTPSGSIACACAATRGGPAGCLRGAASRPRPRGGR